MDTDQATRDGPPGRRNVRALAWRAPGPAQSHLSELGGTASARARALAESLWLWTPVAGRVGETTDRLALVHPVRPRNGDGSVHAHQSPHNYAARGGRQPLSRRTSARLGKSRRGERPSRAATRREGGRRKESMKGRVNAPRPVAAAPRPIRCVQSVHATRGRRGVARVSALPVPRCPATAPADRTACVRTSRNRGHPLPFPASAKGQGSLGLDHRTQQDRGACPSPTEAFYPARPVARRRIS
jgi:hypothetical protein